ncbi:cytochrome c3 family protein [Pseudodesulfovibrio sediminis]|uniref:Cytochrome c3 n=1 Tax=Pseudodesulfovibrio sediminis TaxID=2810563 RepID=A0ABM7P919_9BACT|nr:cytochrome c3 family protein [Pseudodesulfovibrio sediminis]BCS89912.1 cytochrome c3 [Pseudodesulfovibrio sediminis]
MKKVFIMSLLCVCFTAVLAFAQTELVSAIDAPDDDLEINVIKGNSKRDLGVTFNHSSHEDIDCFTCHHKNTVQDEPESCANCHTETDPSAQGVTSYFRAMHVKNPERTSCLSCHVEEFSGDKDLTGCVNSACHPTGLQ